MLPIKCLNVHVIQVKQSQGAAAVHVLSTAALEKLSEHEAEQSSNPDKRD